MPDEYPREITDPDRYEQELVVDREFYETHKAQIRRDYGQQYVAIAFGRLVAVAPTFDEASAEIFKLTPRPEHFQVFQADDVPVFDTFLDQFMEFTAEVIP
jgi:hypothetical protein